MQRLLIVTGTLMALALAVWIGLRAGAPPPLPSQPRAPAPAPTAASVTRVTGEAGAPDGAAIPEAPGPPLEPGTTPRGSQPQTAAASPVLTGPEIVEQWLSSSTDVPSIVQTILAGFPKLDPKDHLMAAGKVAALADDGHYEGVKRLLVDPRTSEEAKELLYRDAFNRGAEVKWPTMFAVMTTPGHPQAKDAHEALVNDLGADEGLNQGAWQARINAALRERAQIGK